MPVLKGILQQAKRALSAPPSRDDYGDVLAMLYQLFRLVQFVVAGDPL